MDGILRSGEVAISRSICKLLISRSGDRSSDLSGDLTGDLADALQVAQPSPTARQIGQIADGSTDRSRDRRSPDHQFDHQLTTSQDHQIRVT
jgi:hypothetical protein